MEDEADALARAGLIIVALACLDNPPRVLLLLEFLDAAGAGPAPAADWEAGYDDDRTPRPAPGGATNEVLV